MKSIDLWSERSFAVCSYTCSLSSSSVELSRVRVSCRNDHCENEVTMSLQARFLFRTNEGLDLVGRGNPGSNHPTDRTF